MIGKIVSVLILIPLTLLIVLFAVANRAPVTLSLDPFGGDPPIFAVAVPVFLVVLTALIVGVAIGGIAAWPSRRKWRRRARRLAAEAKAAHAENAALRRRLESTPAAQPQTSIASIAYRHPNAA